MKGRADNMAKKMMTEKTFITAKFLFKGGATAKQVSEALGIGLSTAGRIKANETYADYQKSVKSHTWTPVAEKPQETKETRYNVTIQATHYMEQELRKTNELLTFISNKLAFIVDELTK
jgi:hypothetical protein